MTKKRIASRLKFLIKQKGCTMSALSNATNIPTLTLRAMISGTSAYYFLSMARIAKYFEVDLDYFID